MLYTKEFFELARRHLNPGGAVTIFVQLCAVLSQVTSTLCCFTWPSGRVRDTSRV
jgi:spermidine synthase